MSLCQHHEFCVSAEIFQSEAIASVQCQLSHSSSDSTSLVHFKTLCLSMQEKILNATSKEEREKASTVLLCLLSGIADTTGHHDLLNSMFDLCQQGHLNKRILYAALVARPELDSLTMFLDHERPFLRDEKNVCHGLSMVSGDILMELFLITVKKQEHWLPFLLNTMLTYLDQGHVEQVEKMLSLPILQFLWPLLFIQMLHRHPDISSLKFCADHTIASDEVDPSIKELARKVSWYLNVVLWLKEENVICQITSSDIFTQTRDTFSLLHKSCDVLNLDWKKTHEFLVQHCHNGPVRNWEISLFDAFHAASLAFNYVLACVHSKHETVKDNHESAGHIEKLSIILCQLQPLSLRLKILENIFSLLFLQYEDFEQDIRSDSEEGEIDINQSFQCEDDEVVHKSVNVLSSSMASVFIDQEQEGQTKAKTLSDNPTNQSSAEVQNWHKYHMKHGFLCDRLMTRNILNLLDSCLTKTRGSDDKSMPEEDKVQMEYVFSYVEDNNVELRLASLQSKVSVALWKLETLLGSDFILQASVPEVTSEKIYLPHWVLQHCFDDDSGSDDESLHLTTSNIGLRRADAEKSSESSSQSNLAGQGQGLNLKWTRKGRRRSSVRYCARGTKDTIIKRMLSSDQNLVLQCLSRGNFDVAKNVIQALEIENSEISAEVNFIEAYRALKHKVILCAEESTRQQHEVPNSKSQNATLLAIQRAASAGVQASSLNKEMEKLISSQHLPCVIDVEYIAKDFLHLFGGSSHDQPVVAAAVDIALMLSSNFRQFVSFLNTASKYSEELQNLQVGVSVRSRPIGFLPLIQNVLQATVVESSSPTELLQRWDVPNFTSRSLRDTMQFWDTLMKLLKELEPGSNYAALYPKLLQLTSSCIPVKGGENKQEYHYLQDFKSYLQLLKACKDRSIMSVPDSSLTEEHFSLLHKSPCKMLANMVLEESMVPQNLEPVALKLGINLPFILSSELCSSLSSVPSAKPHLNLAPINPQKSVHILNSFDTVGPVRHPVQAVEVLLFLVVSELCYQLRQRRKLHQYPGDGRLFASQVNVKRIEPILASTWELRDLDLRLLQPGAETLVFYCNLANLMWIHTLVYLSNTTMFGEMNAGALVAGNSIQQLSVMNSIAYQVGTGSILTLWEVRRLALGVHLMTPLGTKSLQENAPVTDSFDPLALFVVCTGTKHSPKLKVLHTKNLEEQLQVSVQEYVQHWVDVEGGKVSVPPLIKQYIENTGQDMQVFLTNQISVSPSEQIINASDTFKVSYLSDENTPSIVVEYKKECIFKKFQDDDNQTSWYSNINLRNSILEYIKSHCPIITLLLEELLKELPSETHRESDEEVQEATEVTVNSSILSPSFQLLPCLDRLCRLFPTTIRSQMFDSNVLLCALHSVVPDQLLWESINYLAAEQKWKCIVDFLTALPSLQLQSDPLLAIALDLVFFELAIEQRGTDNSWICCEQINSVYFKTKCVISESIYWPGDVCLAQLKNILQIAELKYYPALFSQARTLMDSIEVYQDIVDLCRSGPWKSWQEVQISSLKSPMSVLDQILYHNKAEICVSWLDLHNMSISNPYLIDSRVVALLLNDGNDRFCAVKQILLALPVKKAANLCFKTLNALCRLPALQFCVDFLSFHCTDELSEDYKTTLEIVTLGLQMLKAVPPSVQNDCLELVHNPHLIIEQLLMNVQLEAAELMLNSVQPQLQKLSPKSPLSTPALDSMFRQYAEKALEFRISQSSSGSLLSESNMFLASLSSQSTSKDCQMPPPVVPPKAEWVPNEEAAVCMNCQVSVFTMFNRRHHCRRCGKVVCAPCSPHKVLVEGYGNLKVRICNSCLSKISEGDVSQTNDQPSTVRSESNVSLPTDNLWHLSSCTSSNAAVRGEFAYEYAPNVSLCLSILKLHSESAACPNFLVDVSETILSYLQPQGRMPNPEVDYGFVIEMSRSLVVAAKVKCAQWGYISDEPNCDQRLSKIDLLGLLVSHGCTTLIPTESTTHGLRRLQTQLVEAELWELALEVSTKAGLEKIGVWTSWGKGCLRAGRWKEAREKFGYCFPTSSRINKSAPDSPLLIDILQILESTPHCVDQDVLRKAEALHSLNNRLARAPAVVVLNTLASLKNVSQGKFSQMQGAGGCLPPHVYSECCYYLQEYGSHATYLQFLTRHNDFTAIVEHTLSLSVDPQVFFESVYVPCLRRGQITPLHSAMTAVDSSLAAWTAYLNGICAALERRKLLHTLYEVQQWSKDHVRAAMTCIRFYHLNAKSYTHLASSIEHLMRAQSHLEGALAVASVSRKSVLPGDHNSSSSDNDLAGPESMWLQLTPKEIDHHMSTVERQKEVTKFLSTYETAGEGYRTLYQAAIWFPHAFAEPLVHGIPTLFGSTADRKLLAGLCLFCGKNVEEGYGIVFRIIEGFSLSAYEIYEAVAIALFRSGRASDIVQLLNCVRTSGVAEPSKVCDSVLMACFKEMPQQPNANEIDLLARNISDQLVKIKAFIACGQLKSAYLLAVKYDRLDNIEQILIEAEKLGQEAIKKICLKRLGRT